MSSRRLLLPLVFASAAGLAASALLIQAGPADLEVSAAAPAPRVESTPAVSLDAAPRGSARILASDASHPLSCRGRVLGEFREGAVGVPVEIGIEDVDGAHVLARVESRARGEFACKVESPAELFDHEEARFFARIDHEGYPRRAIRKPIAKLDHEVVFHLSLALFLFVPGHVVDADGAPVKDAVVELRTEGEAGIDASARTNADGDFEMLCRRPGAYRLSAKSDGRGSNEVNPFVVTGEADPDPIRIELHHPDVLEGRVEDTEGRPIRGEELWAFPASLAGSSSRDLFQWRLGASSTAADGVRSAFTTSTDGGSFRFTGLSPGTYFIAPRTELDETTFAPRIWRTGERDVRVVLERWWLEVRHPGSGQGRLFCAGLYDGRAGKALEREQGSSSEGVAVFPVGGGRTYLYGWIDENHAIVEDTVFIPWNQPRTVREIQSGPALAPGSLRITLLTLDADDDRRARLVSVRSTVTDLELWNWSQRSEGGVHALPPGRYFLRVKLERTHSYRDGTPGFETLLVTERTIRIESEQTTQLELRL
jgi:protocatechuate 3,4-dioxygenase beta subunit